METGVGAGPLASLEYDTFLEKGDETVPGLTTPTLHGSARSASACRPR